MQEHLEWRVEQYTNDMDPFANIQWYVMQGNVVIAQCEVESHAEMIVLQQRRHTAYEQVLEHISGMSDAEHSLEAAIEAAVQALERDRGTQ